MNAEFLEKNLVVEETELASGGVSCQLLPNSYTRKNMNAIAFIGAIVENSIHTEAYPITKAYPVKNFNVIRLIAGPYSLFYDPDGYFTGVVKAKS